MKIIIISSCYPKPSNINSGIFVHQQVKALQSLGVECHVIQSVNWFPPFGLHRFHPSWQKGYNQHMDSFKEYEGISIHHPAIFTRMPSRFFNEHHWDAEGRAVSNYILSKNLLRSADLIYAQFLIHEGYIGLVVKNRTKIPLVSIALGDDVHAWPMERPSVLPYINKVLSGSDLILANSHRLALDVGLLTNERSQTMVHTVYQGIDLTRFAPVPSDYRKEEHRLMFGLDKSKHYLLCIARPVESKGWINLFDSIKEMRSRFDGWELLAVVPDQVEINDLNLYEEALRRNINDKIMFIGSIPHHDMHNLMQAVDAFVLPSHNEGLSNAVLEAMASGLPVIATDVGGHSEFIENNINGLLIPPNDTQALVDSMDRILHNELFRKKIMMKARSGAEKIGSYLHNATILVDEFRKIVN